MLKFTSPDRRKARQSGVKGSHFIDFPARIPFYFNRKDTMAFQVVIDYLNGTVMGIDDAFARSAVKEIAYTKEEVDRLLNKVLVLKGVIETADDLPATDNKPGDVWLVREDQTEYVWVADERWELLGPIKEMFYDAAKVRFNKDISLAGSYTSVGNVKITDGSIPADGMSLVDLMETVFDSRIQPTLGTAPSNSVTLTGATALEVGSKFTPKYSVTFTQGKYNQPWNNSTVPDGTTAGGFEVTDTKGATRTTQTGTFDELTVEEGITYRLQAKTTYTAGTVAKDNKGTDSDPVVQRQPGTTAAAVSASVTSFRYAYIGSIAEDVEVTEAVIKGLTKIKTGSFIRTVRASGGDIPLVAGAVKIIVAVPEGATKTSCGGYLLNEVLLVSASNTPITDAYVLQPNTVEVSGAVAGENKKPYKVYIYQPASIDQGEVHSISVK